MVRYICRQGFIQNFEVGGGGGGGGILTFGVDVRVCFSTSLLGESEGMPPPPKNVFLKTRCSEIDSEAFWRYL